MQYSLFDGSGEGLLFGHVVLRRYLDDHRVTAIPGLDATGAIIRDWIKAVRGTSVSKETSLEQKFGHDILGGALGYRLWPPSPGATATAWPKPPSSETEISGEPDFALGAFDSDQRAFAAILELKSPGTDLDAPQSRSDHRTPVEQAFHYAHQLLGVQWVLVSDMIQIRLYSVESAREFERFALDFDGQLSQSTTIDKLRRLVLLLHHDYLISGGNDSPVARLHRKSASRQLQIRQGFYRVYFEIRRDLFHSIREAVSQGGVEVTRNELLEATQRLLDRLMFIYYCEDHPQKLLPDGLIERITAAARQLPGRSDRRVFDQLKELFHEIDSGSPYASGAQVPGYNGELFKRHPVIDSISLPDALHDRVYDAVDPDGRVRQVRGAWGLHVYDFWSELNEHLLGHIFQESLSDLVSLAAGHDVSLADKLHERKRKGIYYTDRLLSDFASSSAIKALLGEFPTIAPEASSLELVDHLEGRLQQIATLRIIDFACGSGAFLVSAYHELLNETWRNRDLLEVLRAQSNRGQLPLQPADIGLTQARVLRECLFGVDLLPQAVEIAKLALWLRSARKGEKVADLGSNLIAADSLDVDTLSRLIGENRGSFDLVIGNPPWGGEVDSSSHSRIASWLGIDTDYDWDSWELFVLVGMRALREGGRLALLVPDSFLYPEKQRLRQILLESATVEKVYSLGPDWFGSSVRMSTVFLQVRNGKQMAHSIRGLLLAGPLRLKAIKGEVPLQQIEARLSRDLPYERSLSPGYPIEVFRGGRDDKLLAQMEDGGIPLRELCDHFRGEEMSKFGLVWVCPGCLSPNTPGEKSKGGGFDSKTCSFCDLSLSPDTVQALRLVRESREGPSYDPFIDGDDITHRYQRVENSKWLWLGLEGWKYKKAAIYAAPKILIRQAGIGVLATYDESGARCPQSVYVYRLKERWAKVGYRHEFVLGALLSRTMAYYIFKRFGEVDPAKAHAKLTHERLRDLPIPKVDHSEKWERAAHAKVIDNVGKLLDGSARLGGPEDREVESDLRKLWRVSPEDGAYLHRELAGLPDSRILSGLFPDGRPGAPAGS